MLGLCPLNANKKEEKKRILSWLFDLLILFEASLCA